MPLLSRVRGRIRRALLSEEAKAVVRDRLTYLSAEKLQRIERAVADTKSVPGAVVEFGVALGGSGILLAKGGAPREFHGFDVFAMIPPPLSDKDEADAKERYRTIKDGASKGIGGDAYYGYRDDLLGDVKRAFARHGLPADDERIAFHKGLFEETWPEAAIESISLAHVDCDWYDPVAYCLRSTAEKLSPGGQIVIDDYHDYSGCKSAVDEFLAAHPDFAMLDGANPILRRRSDPAPAGLGRQIQ